MTITELSVKRPSLIIVIFTIMVFFGFVSYQSLTYELLPDISTPVLSISTMYPGASPAEVETSVTKQIEDAISTLENLESTSGISQESFSTVVAELKYGTDIDQALQEAKTKIDAITALLPEEIKTPSINKFSLSDMPIMRLGATSNMDEVKFTNLFSTQITSELARIEGVAKVSLIGGEEREIAVNVSGDKLAYYKLSLLQVSQAITSANLNFPTGSIKDSNQDILVRLSGKISGLEQMRNLAVSTLPDGSQVYLKDVAEVYDTKKEVTSISRINGLNSLGIEISKQSDGNTVEVSEQVREKIAVLEEKYADIDLDFTIASDSSVFTMEAADAVIHDLLIAVILVAFIMLFFLKNIRNAIIVMVAIPVSIVTTFAVMSLMGFTLNLMSLLALSLVVGILVDDSIVVLENIHLNMEKGKTARHAARDTWNEIGLSVVSITLVIIVVFLPIGLVSGIVADLLRQFSLVVVAATIISLMVSFTLTPFLASRFTKLTHLNPKKIQHLPLIWFEKGLNGIKDGFESILNWTLSHKFVSSIAIFALVFSSLFLVSGGYIGAEFVAAGDNGEFVVNVEMPKETPIEQTNYVTQQIEEYLFQDKNITNVFTNVGGGASGGPGSAFKSSLSVKLVPADQRSIMSDAYARNMKADLQRKIPGAKITAAAVGMMGGANAAPIQITLQGDNLETLMNYSQGLITDIAQVAGTSEVKATVEDGNPEMDVNIDRDKMATLGLSLDRVGATMQNAFTGNTDTRFKDGDYEYDIRVQLDAFERRNSGDLANLTFLNNQGELVKLSQFASIETASGPARLERKDKVTSLAIESNVVGRPVGTVGEEIQAIIDQGEVPAGVTVNFGGDIENQTEAFASLGVALITSLLLVYLIMVALYDNWIQPIVVMMSVPVALIGAFLALAMAMQNLSIFSILGLIMLIGLVVKNAILIVDFVNQLKASGMKTREAVVQGTMERFRPILMTTIAMVIAMIPIAIATGAGAEWKNGLAWVLIGGLTSSMIFTLIIVPIFYLIADNLTVWVQKKRGKKVQEDLELTIA